MDIGDIEARRRVLDELWKVNDKDFYSRRDGGT